MIFFYQIILAVGLAVGLVSAQPRGRVPSFNELLQQGQVFMGQQQMQQAMGAFSTAVEIDPQSAVAHMMLGVAVEQLGHNEQAENEYTKSLKLGENDAQYAAYRGTVAYNLGLVLKRRGGNREAIDVLGTAMEGPKVIASVV